MDTQQSESTQPKATDIAIHYDKGRLQQMTVMANEFFKAKCFGADVQNVQQVLVKMQAGFEMGLAPVEAMNSLYIVNGKITIWGSAMTKRLRLRGWKLSYDETKKEECTVTITKGDESYSHTATGDELRAMNSRAFKFASKDKLRWHAISRLIRYYVPEVLDAGVGYLQEEIVDGVIDVAAEETATPSVTFDDLKKKISEVKNAAEFTAAGRMITENSVGLSEEQVGELRGLAVQKKKELEGTKSEAPAPLSEEKKEDLSNLNKALNGKKAKQTTLTPPSDDTNSTEKA